MTRILITGAAGEIGSAPGPNDPAVVFHGGALCGLEFGGDIARID